MIVNACVAVWLVMNFSEATGGGIPGLIVRLAIPDVDNEDLSRSKEVVVWPGAVCIIRDLEETFILHRGSDQYYQLSSYHVCL